MSEFYPLIFGLVFMLILGVGSALLLKLLNPIWWANLWIKRSVYAIPLFGCLAIIIWGIGAQNTYRWMVFLGSAGAALAAIIQIALLLSLPLSGVMHGIGWLIGRAKQKISKLKPENPDPIRRKLLKSSAAIFPALAVTAGTSGFLESFADTKTPHIKMNIAGLPTPLIGLRILQISDAHLGHYVELSNLEKMLADAQNRKPHLVLITGDLSDDLSILPEALRLIAQLNPLLGTYACLGNHEYYRGITQVKSIYANSPIPLLINSSLALNAFGNPVYLGGADDPRWLRRDNASFLDNTVSQSLREAPLESFKILMSHRPEAFDFAAKYGVNLTLAGHTHGGQMGFGGRAVFETLFAYKYLWGKYTDSSGNQLYTTAGMGHWFPFRLGCPPEAPLIELNRA